MLIPGEIQIAGSYLAAFEGLAAVRMRELGVVLDRAARRGNVAGRVVAGANEALRRQRQWYSVRIAAPPEAAMSDKVVSAKPGFSRGTASSFLAGRERVADHHSGTPKQKYVDLRISGLVVEE
jgi:hypothetical protein